MLRAHAPLLQQAARFASSTLLAGLRAGQDLLRSRKSARILLAVIFLYAATSLLPHLGARPDFGARLITVTKWEKLMTTLDDASKPIGCVAWRATGECSPFGTRHPTADTSCRSLVQFTSGYCECDNGVAVALVGCGMHSFTCFDRCRELGSQGVKFPETMACKAQLMDASSLSSLNTSLAFTAATASGGVQGSSSFNGSALRPLVGLSTQGSTSFRAEHDPELWDALVTPVRAHAPDVVPQLPKRTEDDDWLREGGHMPQPTVEGLRRALASYTSNVSSIYTTGGSVPPTSQHGRGIVMVSGGLRFMVSAWISLAMLRRAGSVLPVEMWFPLLEYPTQPVVAALRERGATCRAFAVPDLDQAGYSLKVAAILLSEFSEVLFLDADNFLVSDPAVLFDSAEYRTTGSLFWRDYWAPTAVPELASILSIPKKDLPNTTFEAGQMLIDKRRHWRGLRLALYLNYYHHVFYDLFTDYMGWGDKETFFYALLAAQEPVAYVPIPTGSVGIVRPFCRRYKTRQLCRNIFTGNTMMQFGPNGTPLFLHANLEKWSLSMPERFADYTRRWQVMQPGGESFLAWSQRTLGVDLEQFAFEQVRSFRCAPFFDEYYAVRLRHGDPKIKPLAGLHPIMPGIEFHQMYRLGHAGTYTSLFERSLLDEALYKLGAASRHELTHVKRVLRHMWGGRTVNRYLHKLERRIRVALLSLGM